MEQAEIPILDPGMRPFIIGRGGKVKKKEKGGEKGPPQPLN